MARTDSQVNIRMPAVLKAKLERAAKDSGCSLTSEIVRRLESSFPIDTPELLKRLSDTLAMFQARLATINVAMANIRGDARAARITSELQIESQVLEEEITSLESQITRLQAVVATEDGESREKSPESK